MRSPASSWTVRTLLLLGAVTGGACASAPKQPLDPAVAGRVAMGDADACRPGGFLVVHNGESFQVQVVALPSAGGAWGAMGNPGQQRLGPVPAGATDTLADMRRELRYVSAVPDGAQWSPPPTSNGAPLPRPKRVSFSCTLSSD